MVIIEILVYVSIASMMVVCVSTINKRGLAKKSDFIYFGFILSLIITQIVIQVSPEIRGSIHSITYICLGTLFALILIYSITRITVSSIETQKNVRIWIGWTMFLIFGISICVLLIELPETKADLYRIPLSLVFCLGMEYYPSALDRLTGKENSTEIRDGTEQEMERHKDAPLVSATETNIEKQKDVVIHLVTESWRFTTVYQRMLTNLDAGEHRKYTSQLRFFLRKMEAALEESGLRIVNVEGQPYDPGMAATPVNIEDFDADAPLVVNRMLEPIIMEGENLIKYGKVTLRSVE